MKKVDHVAYWMGYDLMKNISSEVLQDILPKASNCQVELNGKCYGEAFSPEPLSYLECEQYKDELGIGRCYDIADLWAGAVKTCGGVDRIPSKQDVINNIMPYVYDYSEDLSGYVLNYEKVEQLGLSLQISDGVFPSLDDDVTVIDGGFKLIVSDPVPADGHYEVPDPQHVYYQRAFFYHYTEHLTSIDTDIVSRAVYADAICIIKDDETNLCEEVKQKYSTVSGDCSVTPETVRTAATNGDLSGITPHIVFQNGLKMYIGLNYGDLSELSDAEEENDRKGFLVYMDVNGDSGEGKLWEDVFPFYLLKSGKILAGYREDTPSGGNNRDHLSVNVIYDSYTGDTREVKLLMSDANFRSAACATGYIKSAKYCGGKVQYDICKDVTHDCRMIVKEPIKIF